MEKTGKTTISMEVLDIILWTANECEKRALELKKNGFTDRYYAELSYYLGVKNTLEQLGLVVREDYDFNKNSEAV